jgi:hypothetical protein
MMHTPLYNPSFKTIAAKTVQSKAFIEGALRDIKVLKAKITVKYGTDTAENVIGPNIEHSLRRCLQYFTTGQNVTDEDYDLSYLYAANAAMGIDNVIAKEMPAM